MDAFYFLYIFLIVCAVW